jgi:hypothetical protein
MKLHVSESGNRRVQLLLISGNYSSSQDTSVFIKVASQNSVIIKCHKLHHTQYKIHFNIITLSKHSVQRVLLPEDVQPNFYISTFSSFLPLYAHVIINGLIILSGKQSIKLLIM